MAKQIKGIVVHCSDSKFGDVSMIRDWHVNGNGWRDIGYNAVIYNGYLKSTKRFDFEKDGVLAMGRPLDFSTEIDPTEQGAHARGYNSEYIGVCLIGQGGKFTERQKHSLLYFCKMWMRIVPDIKIYGHYELLTAKGKTCPDIDMDDFRGAVLSSRLVSDAIAGF